MNVIEVRGLCKKFGQVNVLRGLDMTVEQGQVYGFLGRNGAGKSTTLKILVGILTCGSGTVELFGQSMSGKKTDLRARIGYVAQEQNFYGWMTPKDLGAFVRGFYPNWDDELYHKLLSSMDLPRDRKVETFSGGMLAKQGLAMALAHNPPLLVLDEPTAGLDPVARREFLQMVLEQKQTRGTTILFSSHLVEEIERAADTVGILEQGTMLYEGRLDALSRQVGMLKVPEEASSPELGDAVEVLRKLPDGWVIRCQDADSLAALQASPMTLEDIFVELVTHRRIHASS